MSLDPISYSLVKRSRKAVIPSPREITEKSQFWYDEYTNNLKTYDFNKSRWATIKKYIGYDRFDNNLENGIWTNYINIPISTAPSTSIQYKIEIAGDNINVYSNDGAIVLATGTGGLDFWGKVKSNGSDIRVFDETYEQNYFWIELFDITNQKCIIWTKINAGQMELNIAYGNNNCLVSNYHSGNLTFEFFDDFDRTKLNWDNTIGKGISISNSYLRLYKDGTADGSGILTRYDVQIAQKNIGIMMDIVITFKWHYTTVGASGVIVLCPQHKLQDDTTATSDVAAVYMDPGQSYYKLVNGSSANVAADTQTYTANTSYIHEFIFTSSFGTGNLYDSSYSLIHTSTDNSAATTDGTYLTLRNGWGNLDVFDVYVDYIYIRKYIADLTFGTPTINTF